MPIATLPGHARPHGHHQRRIQDVQRDGLAHRVDRRSRRPDRRHSEGSRLPHRGRARAAAGRRGRGARRARRRRSTTDSPLCTGASATCCTRRSIDAGFRCCAPEGRVLHPGRLHAGSGRQPTTRLDDTAFVGVAEPRDRRDAGAGIELLPRAAAAARWSGSSSARPRRSWPRRRAGCAACAARPTAGRAPGPAEARARERPPALMARGHGARDRRHRRASGGSSAGSSRRAGYDLILVARDAGRLGALAEELSAAHGVRRQVLPADLTRDDGSGAGRRADRGASRRLRCWSTMPASAPSARLATAPSGSAGGHAPAPRAGADAAHPCRASRACWRAAAARSSTCRPSPRSSTSPGNVNYCASKAYLTTFSEGLALELAGTGVPVQALCPGFTHTEFHQRMGPRRRAPPAVHVDDGGGGGGGVTGAARAAGPVVCVPGLRNRMLVAAIRLLPRRLVGRLTPAHRTHSCDGRHSRTARRSRSVRACEGLLVVLPVMVAVGRRVRRRRPDTAGAGRTRHAVHRQR